MLLKIWWIRKSNFKRLFFQYFLSIRSWWLLIQYQSCLRSLSTGALILLLLSHVLNLPMVFFIMGVSGLSVESQFMRLMTVKRPLSCIASDVEAPILWDVSFSFEKRLHSCSESCSVSKRTQPYYIQNLSPVTLSVIILFPQLPQTVVALIIYNTKNIIVFYWSLAYGNYLVYCFRNRSS